MFYKHDPPTEGRSDTHTMRSVQKWPNSIQSPYKSAAANAAKKVAKLQGKGEALGSAFQSGQAR